MDKLYKTPSLKLGSSGEDVIKWKKYLNLYGAELDETNDVFDDETEYWTKDLQNMNELDETGVVDSATWERFGFTPIQSTDVSFNHTATDIPVTDTTPFASTSEGIGLKDKYSKAETALSGYTPYVQKKYQSQWGDEIKALMEQITGREKFSYDVNEDALYQQMKDNFIENGKLAMKGTMGQAAAMTGGYGSSFAQAVGQQAYQGELNKLTDAIPEFYQMALDRYTMEGDALLNKYGVLVDQDDREYGRHMDSENIRYQLKQDEYERLLNNLGIAGDDYDRAMEMYYADQDRKNSAVWAEYEAQEEQRKYENSLLQQEYENDSYETWKEREWDRDEDRYKDSASGYTASNGEYEVSFLADGSLDLSSIPGIMTDDASWFDEKGRFIKAEFLGNDGSEDEKNVYRMNGKNVIVAKGNSPYTMSRNDDVEKGVLSNGYQPNNVGGKELTATKDSDYINGDWQRVWETEDGTLYIWDETQNKYLKYLK